VFGLFARRHRALAMMMSVDRVLITLEAGEQFYCSIEVPDSE
jgi:hypothetical protein